MSDPTAAAERLSKGWRAYKDQQHSEGVDAITVAEAWLDEHRADDGELITPDWIDSVGFTKGEIEFGQGTLSVYANHDGGGCWLAQIEIKDDAAWYGCSHTITLPEPQTRGQLRRLAAALGLTLKETL